MPTGTTIRVLVAEDHEMVRQGILSLLAAEEDIEVVAEARDGDEAVRLAEARGPHVAVLDVGLPSLNGISAAARLRKSRPDIACVMLSMHDDAATVDRALRAGARGYVLKGSGVASLCQAIRTAARGEVYLSPGVSDYVLQGYLNAGAPESDPLSEREREVLQLVAEGFTARQIGERLGLAAKTIENHRSRIMDKLGIHTTAGLVRYAMRVGIVR